MSETAVGQELLDGFEGMYADSDSDIRCYERHVVRTRVIHNCPGNFLEALHEIEVGSLAVVEKAIIDVKRRSVYTCEACIREWAQKRTDGTE